MVILNLENNKIGSRGVQYLCDHLKNNKVRKNMFFFDYFTYIVSFRRLLHLVFDLIQSEIKVHNILVVYYCR
jgi:hypothetical protein